MLAGHFGVSYALKAKEKNASLGLLFLAVGFADLLWSLFILLGREQAQLAPTLPSSRLNLYYMPSTTVWWASFSGRLSSISCFVFSLRSLGHAKARSPW